MKSYPTLFRVFLLAVLVIGMGIAAGCNDGGGGLSSVSDSSDDADNPTAAQANLKLGGKWSGIATVDGDGRSDGVPVTATISQNGNAITIRTSLPALGANFSGMIEEDGNLLLTDAFDGETWTTHFIPPTNNRIQIADFVRPPSVEEPDPITNIIDLTR